MKKGDLMSHKEKALEFADDSYRIHVTGRHVEVTDAMKNYAVEKLSKIERIMDRIIDVTIVMDTQKVDHIVEITMKAGNTRMSSSATSTDMYASIDQAIKKLEAQVLHYKSKLNDHHPH